MRYYYAILFVLGILATPANTFVFPRPPTFLGEPTICRLRNAQNAEDEEALRQYLPGLSRREMLSFGPLLSAVLSAPSVLSASPAPANAINAIPAVQEYSILQLKPQKVPFSTLRQYKSIALANGLRVLLVSDKEAIRSQAAFSIAGAGQFSDPVELPGCAHLMEHMVLSSSNAVSAFRKSQDFEDWLEEVEGASNAFTGYEQVCFHFTSPPGAFSEAVTRFAKLFNEPDVFRICQDEEVLKREVRRVSAELEVENEYLQASFLTKEMMNPEHPYSRFARGNLDSLERDAREAGVDVGDRLCQFFNQVYQPSKAVLVVIGPNDINTLERWVLPFSSTLSRKKIAAPLVRSFPEPLKASSKMRQFLLYRPKNEFPLRENIETMSMEWALELDYKDTSKLGKTVVTATQVGFVLSQILGRRGPGSLYYILYRRNWVPPGMQGLPRISFPVDVSGFQLMKLEFSLTLEGFTNRAAVASGVFKAINSVFSGPAMSKFLVSRQILAQYAVVAQLHGYILATRPPDAIELAHDSQVDPESQTVVNPEQWSRFPLPNDRSELLALQKVVKETLATMSDPAKAVIITTASDKAIAKAKEKLTIGESVPFLSPRKWQSAPITGAKIFRDDLLILPGIIGDIFIANKEEDELLPPLTNNLIPPALRPPRLSQQVIDVNEDRVKNWRILLPGTNTLRLRIPRMAPEASIRSCFIFQLLSPRPARANARKAAHAELWKTSFEKAVVDLAELGAPAGLAYDLSFNKFGIRICFLGISQNLPSYARRFCRRLAQHHRELLAGGEGLDPSVAETAVNELRRAGLSPLRKREIEKILKGATAYDAATEAIAFFKSCRGGCAFAQGDMLPTEVCSLFDALESIFRDELGTLAKSGRETPTMPLIDDLVYTPVWKPRFASPCAISGVHLLSDACGRVPR